MSDSRRRFLQQLSLGGFALAGAPSVLGATGATRSAFDAPDAAASPLAPDLRAALDGDAQPTFDTTWAERLTGRYKAVFDVPEVNEAGGVFRAGLWRTHYAQLLNATPADLSPVLVIRHAAMPLIMSHEFWERYDIAKKEKVKHPMTGKSVKRNIAMLDESDGMPPSFAAYALDRQIEAGTVVLGCSMAFSGMVAIVRKAEKLPPAEARAKAMAMMVPGVQLQPNGIFAVTYAQQHGCAYVAAA
jgi:hypothetical protein